MMKINVKIKPNSKEQEIKKTEKGYVVKVRAVPENGKANVELVKLLQRYFKKKVKLIKGLKSREKVLEVEE